MKAEINLWPLGVVLVFPPRGREEKDLVRFLSCWHAPDINNSNTLLDTNLLRGVFRILALLVTLGFCGSTIGSEQAPVGSTGAVSLFASQLVPHNSPTRP